MMHFELRDPNRRLLMDSGRGRDDVRLKRVALVEEGGAGASIKGLCSEDCPLCIDPAEDRSC